MLRLALPALCEQLLTLLVGFSDTLLAGWYFQTQELAAISLVVYLMWMVTCLFMVISIGATAMTARFVGRGNHHAASRATNQALVVGGAFAVVFVIAGAWLIVPTVNLMQLEGPAGAFAVRYVRILLPCLPLLMVEQVGIACLRGAGDMVAGLVVMSVVNVINVTVSWSLVLGIGGLPELGWDGLAVGTALGHTAGGLLVLGMLLGGRSGLRLRARWLVPNLDLIRRLLRIGLPGGADVVALVACQLWFVSIINRLGDVAAAAHGIAIRIESLAYLPGVAFEIAAATLAGQFLGAGDHRRATQTVVAAVAAAATIICSAGLVFLFAAAPLARLFVPGQPEVVVIAASLLRIVSTAMPALAVAIVLTGALRGAGDTRWPLAITLAGFIGVRMPLAYWLALGTSLGARGAWIAMVIDVNLRCALILYRFWHGGWKRVRV